MTSGQQRGGLPWVLLHGIAFELQPSQADKELKTLQHGHMLQTIGGQPQVCQRRQAPLLCNSFYTIVMKI